MKFFVFFLIVANLLMFAWVRQQESAGTDGTASDVAAIPSGAKPLQLLSETRLENDGQSSVKPATEAAVADVMPASDGVIEEAQIAKVELPEETRQQQVCQTVGPFADQAVVYEGAAWLKQHGRQGVVRSEKSKQLRDYWVYVPSMPAKDADRTVAEFEDKGVKDYYRGRKNEISLGIYSKEHVAERRRTQIAALGYAPVLEPRYRNRTLYWLDLSELESDVLSNKEWAGFLVNHPNTTRQPVSCP